MFQQQQMGKANNSNNSAEVVDEVSVEVAVAIAEGKIVIRNGKKGLYRFAEFLKP